MVNTFHKFTLNEKDNPSEGGNSIRRGKKDIDQNSPSKSGIEYKKNMSYQKADTGITSANNYLVYISEAVNAIDEMTSIVASSKPELAKYANTKKTELGSSLEPNLESHIKVWDGLEDLATYLYDNKPKSGSNAEVIKKYQEDMMKLEKDMEDRKIPKGEYDQKKADIQKDARGKIDKAQDIYYRKMNEALPYFLEAIKAFKQGAIVEIKNVDKEEAKSGDINSESNFTDWLEQATQQSISTLYKNKK